MEKISSICCPSSGRNLKVMMPKVCNYRCSYCFQQIIEGPFDPFFFTGKKLDIIGTVVDSFNIDRITLIGGEPTLFVLSSLIGHHWSHPIKEYFIITNFSKSNDFFLQLEKQAREVGSSIKLCCSLHDEFVDYQKFVDKANELYDRGLLHLAVEFVIAKHNRSSCFQIIDYIKTHLRHEIFFIIDCDAFDKETKKFYETNMVSSHITATDLDYTVYFDNGKHTCLPRQELRLLSFQEPRYCITDFSLSEDNRLFSCYRDFGVVGDKPISELLHEEKSFLCNLTSCRFCDGPHIFYHQEEFKEYLSSL